MKKFILLICLAIFSYTAKAQIYYVNPSATGTNDGSSWTNAFTYLQNCLATVNSGEVWVAAGTYYPGTSGSNSATFLMEDNLAIYGGFNGTETLLSQRNPLTNVTILSGDLDLSGTPTALDAYHVVSTGNTGSTAILDGFTITMGNAFGTFLDGSGAGLFCAPTVTGIYSPRIEHCKFISNVAAGDGGAIYVNGYQTGGSITSPAINYCSFSSNSATGYGGAVYLGSYGSGAAASPRFENCFFNFNTAGATGNLVVAVSGGNGELYPVFTNCTLYGNGTNDEILYQSNGFPGSVTLNNCIAYNIDMFSNVTITANNTDANSPYISGTNNISADPQFVNPGGNDFSLQCYSPCVDLGSAGFTTLPNDLAGNPRISNATVDMGAYEGTFTLPTVNANANSTNICAGGLLTLTGSGDPIISYSWTSGASDGVPFSPFSTDTYTVTAFDALGCPGSDTITVFVNPLPVITANASASGVCAGGTVTLYGTGGVNYAWTHGVNDNVPFMPGSTETYTVTGINAYGCQSIDMVTVMYESTAGFSAGADILVCNISPMTAILAGNNAGFPSTWTSTGSGTFSDISSPASSYIFSNADSLAGYVQLTLEISPIFCGIQQDVVTIYREDQATCSAGADVSRCDNIAGNISVTGTSSNASATLWTTNTGGNIINPVGPGILFTPSAADSLAGYADLYFTATPYGTSCPTVIDTMHINLFSAPKFDLGPDYTWCQYDSIALTANITGGTLPFTYQWWTPNLGNISSTNSDAIALASADGLYLTVTDVNGCTKNDNVYVTIDNIEGISVTVNTGAGVLSDGVMYVMKYIPQQMIFDTAAVVPFTGNAGSVFTNPLNVGNYIIKIVPDSTLYPNLIPTYYGNVFQWDSATVVNLGCVSPFFGSMNMISLLGGTGNGTISGFIIEDNGYGTRPGVEHNHIMAPGGPLKGIDVKLGRNPGGGIQARTMSDSTGYYHFDSIPNHSYRIYVDIPGLPMDSFYIVNVQADSSVNLNYYVDSNSVFPVLDPAIGINNYTATTNEVQLYPNPATSVTSLLFTSEKQNHATIKILDITGKQVMRMTLTNLPKGKHEYQINFANQQLQSGIYFVELINENGKQTKKLIVE